MCSLRVTVLPERWASDVLERVLGEAAKPVAEVGRVSRAPARAVRALVPCKQGAGDCSGPGKAGGAKGRWFITPHAVRQYRERCPGKRRLGYNQALGELVAASESAHLVRNQRNGSELWRGGKPWRLRFIVCSDRDGLPQLVTVLPGCDRAMVDHGKEDQGHEGR